MAGQTVAGAEGHRQTQGVQLAAVAVRNPALDTRHGEDPARRSGDPSRSSSHPAALHGPAHKRPVARCHTARVERRTEQGQERKEAAAGRTAAAAAAELRKLEAGPRKVVAETAAAEGEARQRAVVVEEESPPAPSAAHIRTDLAVAAAAGAAVGREAGQLAGLGARSHTSCKTCHWSWPVCRIAGRRRSWPRSITEPRSVVLSAKPYVEAAESAAAITTRTGTPWARAAAAQASYSGLI